MFRKRSVPPNRGGQVCLQKHTCLLLVLQLLRQERGERRAPKSASNETLVKTQTCSKFVTTWGPTLRREAQPMLSEKQPNPTRAKATLPPTCPTLQLAPPRAQGSQQHPKARGHGQARWQTRWNLRMSPGLEGEGSPYSCLLPPLEHLQIGLSENGFHNSFSGNQLFTTSLPTNS